MARQLSWNAGDDLFEIFWRTYPRRENPQRARSEFKKSGITSESLPAILTWIERAKLSEQWQNKSKIPHPSTWLHQKRWLGDPPPIGKDKADLQVGSNGDGVVDPVALNHAVASYHERERKAQEKATQKHADAILAKPAALRTKFERQWLEMWRKKT